MPHQLTTEVNGRTLSIETGRVAKQATGAVWVQFGETIVLVTVVSTQDVREGIDFLPLTVDYKEMAYAAGRIPGSFFRREIGRPGEKETLTSRLIDRPLRPLFPKDYFYETQVIATVLSVDQENDPDILAIIGASAALEISDIPFQGPIAGIRVGRINGELVLNPTSSQLKESDFNIIVAGTQEAVVMVEGWARMTSEEYLVQAVFYGHQGMQGILEMQKKLSQLVGPKKRTWSGTPVNEELKTRMTAAATPAVAEALTITGKMERHERIREILLDLQQQFGEDPANRPQIRKIFENLERDTVRRMIVKEKKRIDGRKFNEVRPISCEVGVLPRTHGSALFTRGETQVLAVATLGTSSDEQRIDSLIGETFKSFMLHYNFPPFSVGEARMLRGPGRREIGHGALAERSLLQVLPSSDTFPYTVRIVSEVLESNGSSSMATVCGGSLSLMDAGVPITAQVAGIAMGLIMEEEEVIILTDILGDEDHSGDMDFKVTGTVEGVTGLQMDIKVQGVNQDIMGRALQQAREARLSILKLMEKTIAQPRTSLSDYAPKITTIEINPEKIREVIGPGGKVIRAIVSETGAKIEVEDSGKVIIASPDGKSSERAIAMILEIVQEVEIGRLYMGKVKKIMDFGAFVEVLPGTEGLIHISQLDNHRVNKVTDVLQEGDEVLVKVLEVDKQG
ncbi:MAG TPA: polyribonucleotide nucleotidyltransferase, partial [Thermodesulfobacteriota bacterium]|nr:polyribonucleotide nucleotidyltransferase [Thermodesulfobacteriota bacterium]